MKKAAVGMLLLFFTGVFFISCEKELDKELENEDARIQSYLSENDIDVEPKESGLYYIEIEEGDSISPVNDDMVIVDVKGTILNRPLDEIQADSNIRFVVGKNQVIAGLDEGVTYMRMGGKAKLIVPFKLAYYEPGNYTDYNTYHFELNLNNVVKDPKEWELERINTYIEDDTSIHVQTDTSGFYYIEEVAGEGTSPQEGDRVKINYKVTLLDHSIIDTSDTQPLEFTLGQKEVISGLEKGVKMMKPEGEATMIIPSSMAYGNQVRGSLMPYSTLVYKIRLLSVN